MKRSLISFAFLSYCVIFIASLFADTVAKAFVVAKDVYQSARLQVAKVLTHALELAAPSQAGRNPSVYLVKAKEFVLRILKRERPVVTASWRACPSI